LCLESGLQAQVLARLVDLDEVTPEALEAVQRSLTTRLQQHLHGKKRRAAGLETVRQILRAAGPLAEHELRRAIDRFDRNLARQLGGVEEDAASSATDAELTFDDLAELEAPQLRKVLVQTPAAIRTLALAGGSAAFAERCYGLLSRSQAKQLRRDLANIGPTSMRDIAAAQQAMAAVARDLLAVGAIRVPRALVESPR
jgi:flagellar motor switch protein FliG